MKKFNYEVVVEAPSKEIADLLMKFICAQNVDVIDAIRAQPAEKVAEPPFPKNEGKKQFLNGIVQVEKVIQIIKHCVQDETALDRIAEMFGIHFQSQKTTQQ